MRIWKINLKLHFKEIWQILRFITLQLQREMNILKYSSWVLVYTTGFFLLSWVLDKWIIRRTIESQWPLGLTKDQVLTYLQTELTILFSFIVLLLPAFLVVTQLAAGKYSNKVVRVFVENGTLQFVVGVQISSIFMNLVTMFWVVHPTFSFNFSPLHVVGITKEVMVIEITKFIPVGTTIVTTVFSACALALTVIYIFHLLVHINPSRIAIMLKSIANNSLDKLKKGSFIREDPERDKDVLSQLRVSSLDYIHIRETVEAGKLEETLYQFGQLSKQSIIENDIQSCETCVLFLIDIWRRYAGIKIKDDAWFRFYTPVNIAVIGNDGHEYQEMLKQVTGQSAAEIEVSIRDLIFSRQYKSGMPYWVEDIIIGILIDVFSELVKRNDTVVADEIIANLRYLCDSFKSEEIVSKKVAYFYAEILKDSEILLGTHEKALQNFIHILEDSILEYLRSGTQSSKTVIDEAFKMFADVLDRYMDSGDLGRLRFLITKLGIIWTVIRSVDRRDSDVFQRWQELVTLFAKEYFLFVTHGIYSKRFKGAAELIKKATFAVDVWPILIVISIELGMQLNLEGDTKQISISKIGSIPGGLSMLSLEKQREEYDVIKAYTVLFSYVLFQAENGLIDKEDELIQIVWNNLSDKVPEQIVKTLKKDIQFHKVYWDELFFGESVKWLMNTLTKLEAKIHPFN